jgi:hypothetical protein
MPDTPPPIRVNRAPVLTLWATVVAERLGYPPETALTLGRFVAGSSARAKARRLGISDEKQDAEEHYARAPLLTGPGLRDGGESIAAQAQRRTTQGRFAVRDGRPALPPGAYAQGFQSDEPPPRKPLGRRWSETQ